MPVFVGHPNITDGYDFDNPKILLPDIVPRKTTSTAAAFLRKLGVAENQIQIMEKKTVKDIVSQVFAFQGIRLSKESEYPDAIPGHPTGGGCPSRASSCVCRPRASGSRSSEREVLSLCAKRILKSCQREIGVMSSNPTAFVSVRPMGQEVMEWLEENVIESYAPVLAMNGMDSLFAISCLKDEEIKQLAEEHRDMYRQKSAKPLLGDHGDLRRAMELLKKDQRARPLNYRLEDFRDPKVSALGMLSSNNSVENILSKTGGQMALALVIIIVTTSLIIWIGELINLSPGFTLHVGEEIESGVIRMGGVVCGASFLIFVAYFGGITVSVYFRYTNIRQSVKYIFNGAAVLSIMFIISGVISLVQCSANEDVKALDSLYTCQTFLEMLIYASTTIIIAILVKYRQEYVVRANLIIQFSFLLWSGGTNLPLESNSQSRSLHLFFGFLTMGILVLLQFGVFAAKFKAYQLAKRDVESSEAKWKKLTSDDTNCKALDELAEAAHAKKAVLDAQYKDHVARSSYFARLLFVLRTIDDKFASSQWGGTVKVRQVHKNLDVLFAHAALINLPFQNLAASILLASGASSVIRGPVKKPERAIEKVVRSYRRDSGCLTDLVRCTCTADSCEQLLNVTKAIFDNCEVGTTVTEDHSESGALENDPQSSQSKKFRLVKIKNLFDIKYDCKASAGYRSVSIDVEVGWEIEAGAVVFIPVSKWGNVRRHVCEVQIHLAGFNNSDSKGQHSNYVQWRNTLTR